MTRFFKKYSIDFIFIFLLSLTPLFWYKGGSVMFGHDNVFPLDPIVFLTGRLSTWVGHGFGQSQALIMGTIPIHLLDAIPYILGMSLQQTQQMVYIFWFFMMGFGAYVLAHAINPESRIFKLTAVLLYQFNFFILQGWWIGERTKFSAYIAFPLVLAVFLKVYRNNLSPLKGAIYTSFILFIFNAGGLFGISLYGGFFVGISIFILFFSFLSFFKKQYQTIKRLVLLSAFSVVGFILLNAYYIFPVFSQFVSTYTRGVQRSGGLSGFVDWASVISANASYINIMRLQGIAEWYDNPQHPYARFYFENPLLIALSFLWLILILCALIIVKKREKLEIVLYLFLAYLLGIFFTAGTHPPLGFLYEFFIKHVPGAVAFRSPYFKFAPIIFLTSSFLIAFFVDHFRGKIKYIIFIFLTVIVLIYHFPYFTGNFFSQTKGFSTRLEVPEYVFEFGKWINEDNITNERILMLPPNNPDLGYSKYNWGYLSFQSLPTFFTNKSFVINNDSLNEEERLLTSNLYESIALKDKHTSLHLISSLGIKYFVLQEDTVVDSKSPLPLDFKFYKDILENDLNFSLVKKIDKWSVYKAEDRSLPQFFTTNNLAIIQGASQSLDKFYNIEGSDIFAKKEDATIIPENLISGYYVSAECLNCDEGGNVFILPERNILPDSPLYPLVLFNEQLKLKKSDKKNKIYDYLGLTLKRAGEIKGMIILKKRVDGQVIRNYNLLLEGINNNFNQLENYEEKFKLAKDIYFFLENERIALTDLFGTYATYGESIVLIGDATSKIATTLETIDPYLFKLNIANNRLYQTSIAQDGNYNVFLKKDDLRQVRSSETIALNIDNSIKKEVKEESSLLSDWIDFGVVSLDQGKHNFLVTFPNQPNIAGDLKEDKTEVNVVSNTKCFTGKIRNFDSKKTYKVKLNYKNDFSESLFYYVWELKKSEKKLYNVQRLRTSSLMDEFINLIKADVDSQGVLIGICSRALTEELMKSKISISINEILQPKLVVATQQFAPTNIDAADVKHVSPTKYSVSFKNYNKNTFLVFLERFDSGWRLSGFEDKHFRINGFANAWVIDKTGDFSLILEYGPEKAFTFGKILTLLTVLGAFIYLLADRVKYKKEHDKK